MSSEERGSTAWTIRGVVIIERRQHPTAARMPTTLWSTWRFRGRRKGFRRLARHKAYVDCPSQRAVVLLFFRVGASVLDALCTLLFIQNGGSEANPLMSLVLSRGQAPFVGIKMALTGHRRMVPGRASRTFPWPPVGSMCWPLAMWDSFSSMPPSCYRKSVWGKS